jgi:hypothetical protein
MAYMSQERKKELAPGIRAVLKKYGVKGTIAVNNHSTLVVNLREGRIDFENSLNRERNPDASFHYQVNTYWLEDHWTGDALSFLQELKEAMNIGNFDKSDIMTDYFHVGWYTDINIGRWDRPYAAS